MNECIIGCQFDFVVDFLKSTTGLCLLCDNEHSILYINDGVSQLLEQAECIVGKKFEVIFPTFLSDEDRLFKGGYRDFLACAFSGNLTCRVGLKSMSGKDLGQYQMSTLQLKIEGLPCYVICLTNITNPNFFPRGIDCASNMYLQDKLVQLSNSNEKLRLENVERRAVAKALLRAESRYRDIFDNAVEAIFQWTYDWMLISANRSCAAMLGYETVNNMMQDVARQGFTLCHDPAVKELLHYELETKGGVSNFEFQVYRRDGSFLWVNLNARRVAGVREQTSYYEGFMEDISERYDARKRLEYQAFHDTLTGLANRALFTDHLQMALSRFMRNKTQRFAVLFLDLNHFKLVNDTYGHAVGDKVLQQVGGLIHSCVREHDTVARFGGDEFGIILADFEDAGFVINAAERVRAALGGILHIGEHTVQLGVSIGIVISAEKYTDIDQVLRDADTAMYKAKMESAQYYKVFNMELEAESIFKANLRKAVYQCAEGDDFDIGFYPIINAATKQLEAVEGILIWKHDTQTGTPKDIMQIAESMGIGPRLNSLKLHKIFSKVTDWAERLGRSLNVYTRMGRRLLLQPDFYQQMQGVIRATGVDPTCVHLVVNDLELLAGGSSLPIRESMEKLGQLGIKLCLGEFGSSVSSVALLQNKPVGSVKISRSIVEHIANDIRALTVVKSLTKLGKDVGLTVIVDGIDKCEHLDIIKTVDDCYCQGYFVSPFLNSTQVESYL